MLVVVIVSPTLMLTSFFGSFFENADFGWSCTLALYMIVALACIFTIWKTTKGYERHRENTENIRLKDFAEVLKNKAIRMVMAMFALGVFGNTINLSLQVYYFGYYVEMNDAQIASVTMASGIIACVAAFGVDWLCQRVSKKAAWLIAVGLEAAAMILFIGFLIQPGGIGMVYVCFILMQLGVCAIYQVPWSMIPDCVDVNELVSKKRIDGLIFGLVALLQKVSGAIAIAVVGVALTAIGYVADGVQSVETLQSLKYLYAFGCGGIFLASILFAIKYPLSKKQHEEVLRAIHIREKGEEIDMSKFQNLV